MHGNIPVDYVISTRSELIAAEYYGLCHLSPPPSSPSCGRQTHKLTMKGEGSSVPAGVWQWLLHHCGEQLNPKLGLDNLVSALVLCVFLLVIL